MQTCMWCKGRFPKLDGPVHPYIESTPGCWDAYSRLLALKYQEASTFNEVNQIIADTYAVQHPGQPSPKARQSVWCHLVSLYYSFEKGALPEAARKKLTACVEQKKERPWLEPPSFEGTKTVDDVLEAKNPQQRSLAAKEWGQSVWEVWFKKYPDEITSAAINA